MRPPVLPPPLSLLFVLTVLPGCSPAPNPAEEIVGAVIARHGGPLLEESRVRFRLGGVAFESLREGPAFRYERSFRDPLGRSVSEVLDPTGARRTVDGAEVSLTAEEAEAVRMVLGALLPHFGPLPDRFGDPSVQLRTLEPEEIAGESYHRIEVGRTQEGETGPVTRSILWIHPTEFTLDYWAQAETVPGEGPLFLRAVNRRTVGGVLVQDFETFAAPGEVVDLAALAVRFQAGTLEPRSFRAAEAIEVRPAEEPVPPLEAPASAAPGGPGEGLEVQLGMDRVAYRSGAPIQVVLRLLNRAGPTHSLTFPTAQRFDLLLLDEAGNELWRWSTERGFAQVVGEELLSAGASLAFEETVPAPERPGAYFLQGRIAADGVDLQAALPLEVIP